MVPVMDLKETDERGSLTNESKESVDMYRTASGDTSLASHAPLTRKELTARRQVKNGHGRSKSSFGSISKVTGSGSWLSHPGKKRVVIIATILGTFGLIVAIAAVAAVLANMHHTAAYISSSSSSTNINTATTNGTDGSQITMANGTIFVYENSFGGDWREDPTNPLAVGGKAQSWGKRVGEEDWVWGEDIIRGVNLGGWLVTEPFITPALYEAYVNNSDGIVVVDEWTLALAMGEDLAPQMEAHYSTFITEQDFAEVAGAGLNWVRIPIGFWVIETMNDEPFLVGTSWSYFLLAIQWCRKYGLRIYLDLHALPGSQNGYNHSGRAGAINFMNGIMGVANAQRTLTYLRILTEFVSQEQYRDVVQMVGIVNEILWDTIGQTSVESFYYAAYDAMRGATGIGSGNGPYVVVHDGFQGVAVWEGFMQGADRLAVDQHPYLAFTGDYDTSLTDLAKVPCNWGAATNQSSSKFGVTVGGEWSTAINNCGKWLNGIGSEPDSEYDCDTWDDWTTYNATTIASLKNLALASMDALQNNFFWTWKIGESTELGRSSSPLWNYKLGREQGWIPLDPRVSFGHCSAILNDTEISLFDGSYPASATGVRSCFSPLFTPHIDVACS